MVFLGTPAMRVVALRLMPSRRHFRMRMRFSWDSVSMAGCRTPAPVDVTVRGVCRESESRALEGCRLSGLDGVFLVVEGGADFLPHRERYLGT